MVSSKKKVSKSDLIEKKIKQNRLKKAKAQAKKEREEKLRAKELSKFELERQKVRENVAEKEANTLELLKFYRDEYPELSLDRIKDMIYNETGMRIPKSLSEGRMTVDTKYGEEEEKKRIERQKVKADEEKKRIEQQKLKAEEDSKKASEKLKELQLQAKEALSKTRLANIQKQIDEEKRKILLQRERVKDYKDKLAVIEEKKRELEATKLKIPKYAPSLHIKGPKLESYITTRVQGIKKLEDEIEKLQSYSQEVDQLEKERMKKKTGGSPEKKSKRQRELETYIGKSNSVDQKKEQIEELKKEIREREQIAQPLKRVEELEKETSELPIAPVVESDDDIRMRIEALEAEARQIENDAIGLPQLIPDGQPVGDEHLLSDEQPVGVSDGEEEGHGFKFLKRYMIHPKDLKLGKAGALKFTKRGQKHANLLVKIHGPKKAGHLVGISILNAVANKLKK